MNTVFVITGFVRVILAAAGLYYCSRGRSHYPLPSRCAILGFSSFFCQALVVMLLGLGITALAPLASMLTLIGLGALAAVFALTAP